MARTLLKGAEIALPTTTGTATSFSQATVVRLVNTGSVAVVEVVESQSGAGVGSFTMPANTVEYLEKTPTHCVFASAATVKGAQVGFTG
jgi:hypothetical protein